MLAIGLPAALSGTGPTHPGWTSFVRTAASIACAFQCRCCTSDQSRPQACAGLRAQAAVLHDCMPGSKSWGEEDCPKILHSLAIPLADGAAMQGRSGRPMSHRTAPTSAPSMASPIRASVALGLAMNTSPQCAPLADVGTRKVSMSLSRASGKWTTRAIAMITKAIAPTRGASQRPSRPPIGELSTR